MQYDLDEFTRAYLKCALWSSSVGTDDDDRSLGAGDPPNVGTPWDLGKTVDDCDPEFIEQSIRDCAKFQKDHADMIADDIERAGHDFWLTRCGHGCGFWDGDWPEPDGDILTEAAHAFGEVYLYLGDNGKVYADI